MVNEGGEVNGKNACAKNMEWMEAEDRTRTASMQESTKSKGLKAWLFPNSCRKDLMAQTTSLTASYTFGINTMEPFSECPSTTAENPGIVTSCTTRSATQLTSCIVSCHSNQGYHMISFQVVYPLPPRIIIFHYYFISFSWK